MPKLTLFYLKFCPYCRKAMGYLEELRTQDKYKDIEIEMIEESQQPELADRYDYYYVPTFFAGDQKLFEGAMEYSDVQKVLDQALL